MEWKWCNYEHKDSQRSLEMDLKIKVIYKVCNSDASRHDLLHSRVNIIPRMWVLFPSECYWLGMLLWAGHFSICVCADLRHTELPMSWEKQGRTA